MPRHCLSNQLSVDIAICELAGGARPSSARTISATSRLSLGCLSAVSRLSLRCLSAVSRLSLLSAVSLRPSCLRSSVSLAATRSTSVSSTTCPYLKGGGGRQTAPPQLGGISGEISATSRASATCPAVPPASARPSARPPCRAGTASGPHAAVAGRRRSGAQAASPAGWRRGERPRRRGRPVNGVLSAVRVCGLGPGLCSCVTGRWCRSSATSRAISRTARPHLGYISPGKARRSCAQRD